MQDQVFRFKGEKISRANDDNFGTELAGGKGAAICNDMVRHTDTHADSYNHLMNIQDPQSYTKLNFDLPLSDCIAERLPYSNSTSQLHFDQLNDRDVASPQCATSPAIFSTSAVCALRSDYIYSH